MTESLDRRRALYAWGQIRGRKLSPEDIARLKGLPIEVRTLGLITVVALLEEDDEGLVLPLLKDWLLRECPRRALAAKEHESPLNLLDACIRAPRKQYLAAQREAISFLYQVKILACALNAQKEL
jgi:hypothetical protein